MKTITPKDALDLASFACHMLIENDETKYMEAMLKKLRRINPEPHFIVANGTWLVIPHGVYELALQAKADSMTISNITRILVIGAGCYEGKYNSIFPPVLTPTAKKIAEAILAS